MYVCQEDGLDEAVVPRPQQFSLQVARQLVHVDPLLQPRIGFVSVGGSASSVRIAALHPSRIAFEQACVEDPVVAASGRPITAVLCSSASEDRACLLKRRCLMVSESSFKLSEFKKSLMDEVPVKYITVADSGVTSRVLIAGAGEEEVMVSVGRHHEGDVIEEGAVKTVEVSGQVSEEFYKVRAQIYKSLVSI